MVKLISVLLDYFDRKDVTPKYPHADVTVDSVLIHYITDAQGLIDCDKSTVLLIKRGHEPFKNMWCFPGGFINMNETLEQSALRELQEETGIVLSDIDKHRFQQFRAFGDPKRDPRKRIISIVHYALIDYEYEVKGADDAVEARWWPLNKIMEMGFDHAEILRAVVGRVTP